MLAGVSRDDMGLMNGSMGLDVEAISTAAARPRCG